MGCVHLGCPFGLSIWVVHLGCPFGLSIWVVVRNDDDDDDDDDRPFISLAGSE